MPIRDGLLERKNLFPHRIEVQLPFLEIRDVTQMTRLGTAVADVDVSVRLLTAFHAIEKVLHVKMGHVAWRRIDGNYWRPAFGGLEFVLLS